MYRWEMGEGEGEEGQREHQSETTYLLSVRNTEVFDNYLFLPISSSTTKISIVVLLRKLMKICYKTHKEIWVLGKEGIRCKMYHKTWKQINTLNHIQLQSSSIPSSCSTGIHIHMFLCGGAHAHECCVWRSQVDLGIFCELSPLWGHLTEHSWPVSLSLVLEVLEAIVSAWLPHGFWASKLLFSYLWDKYWIQRITILDAVYSFKRIN